MSSGEGVSKQNGIIGSPSVGVVLGLPAHCLVFPDKTFLFVQSKCFLRLRKDRVMANSEGSAKTDKSSPRPTRDEEGEGRFMSELRCPSPCSCDWEISTLRSMDWFSWGVFWQCGLWSRLCSGPPPMAVSAGTPALSGFSGESSEAREYCDPFEVVEVLPLCSDAASDTESSSERLGGCFITFDEKLVPRVNTGRLCF